MILNENNPSDKRKYPPRWPMMKGKRLFTAIDVRSETGEEELLTVSHITGITPRKMKNVTMFQAESLIGYKKCEINDIAANTMWMWQGAIGVSKYEGVISPSYNVYRQKDEFYNPQYLDYLLREPTLVDVYHSLSTGIRPSRLRLYPEQLFSIDFPVPPIEEQEKMVKYIKWRLTKINSIIQNLRSQIELIKEEKSIVLYDALTKGVGKQHEFVRCEEPCIESIPSDWVLSKLKYQCKMYNGDSISDSDKEKYTIKTEIPYIATKDVNLRLCTANYENGLYVPVDSKFKIAPAGSILVCIEGGSAGKKKALLEKDVAFVNKLCAFV
ncbi:MAG: restriction endonuclease subunit S, partial [Erysipelotrichaceae bacterium]|nr:restriction endonuclease subunit S [Erysipelotrichaceae bacterium]